MSSAFDEITSRLKQKAKTAWQIHYNVNFSFKPIEYFKNETWVRLEDVESAIQQIKQDYVLVKIGDLEATVYTSTKYENLRDIVDDLYGNYDDVAREAYALGVKDLARRLLKSV